MTLIACDLRIPLRRSAELLLFVGTILCLAGEELSANEYAVGPGRQLANLDAVPWESLLPGDVVTIHHREKAYRAKWVLCRQGTAAQPIIIRGVVAADGSRPVIEGQNAIPRPLLSYTGESRGVIKIGSARFPPDTMPAHIVIENLEVRGARPPHFFFAPTGLEKYAHNAAAIFIEKGVHITLRNCYLHDSANGLFTASNTRDIRIENCVLSGNGIEDSFYEHNAYTESRGIVFQFNRFGPLRSGCRGNNLKDRSAGLVVRFNWIEGGNRQLDLVDAEGAADIRNDPRYRATFVYGNVLFENSDDGNSQIVHYGGDSGTTEWYRQGMLYFFNNTVVSKRTGNTTIFRLSTNAEQADCRNNIFYVTAPGRKLALMDEQGSLLMNHNWLNDGWQTSHDDFQGRIFKRDLLGGKAPGFLAIDKNDFRLRSDSPCIDAGIELTAPFLPKHNLTHQLGAQGQITKRQPNGPLDLGASEFNPGQ